MNKKRILITAGLLLLLAGVYFGFSIYFNQHFYFRSTVNGVDASAASASEVAKRLTDAGDDYSLTITETDGSSESISAADIDLAVNADADTVSAVLEKQNGFAWIKYLFSPMDYKSDSIVSYDEDSLQNRVDELSLLTEDHSTVTTENASCQYVDGEFKIVDEVYGDNFNAKQLYKKIASAVSTLTRELDVEEDQLYAMPTITSDDKDLQASIKLLNSKAKMKITYDLGSSSEEIPGETLASWLSCENGEISYDTDAMAEYISEMASKYNTVGKPKTLKTTYGATVTVPGGTYGWKIDTEGELEQLIADLDAGDDVTRDFVYSVTAANHSGADSDYGNSYLEINLTAQHLYLYVDGVNVFDTSFVSGCVSKNTITHVGSYYVAYKQKDATLRGDNYATPVSYWMPFHNGEGLHDATWRDRFGGSIYKTNGSHGCVNLPYSAAATIFDYVSSGFPVLVYELAGTEDTSLEESEAAPVVEKINAIGSVTIDSGNAISAARVAYESLSTDAKPFVTNLSVLESAESTYNALVAASSSEAAATQAAQAKTVADYAREALEKREAALYQ